MINTKTDTKKIGLIMLVIMMACSVVSFGSKALAQSDLLPESRQSSGMNKVIPGTENWNGKHDIAVGSFFKNMWEKTGIYKMIDTKS